MKPLVHFDENATGAGGVTPPPVVTPPAAPPSLTGAPSEPPKVDPVIPEPGREPPKVEEPKKEEPKAPEPFALDKVKLPDGMKADDPTLKSFGELMSKDMAPAERGQALLDLYADVTKQAREASTEAWNNVQKDWQTKTLADPIIGGAKWQASQATIAKAIDTLDAPLAAEFRQALDVTGAGNHPAVSRALHAWATKLTEGTHVGGNPAKTQQTVKEAFYPNSPDMK
jgi:hypothetical protein